MIYVLMAANKRLLISESHDDLDRCTPCRENPTNMPHASHDQSRPYVSHVVNA
jgi:hypothetical protein